MEILFLLLWGFFLYKAVFGRKKKSPELPEEPPPPVDAPTAEDGAYDYEALRRKIKKSWGEKEEQEPLPSTPAAEVSQDENYSLHSSSISDKIGADLKPCLKSDTPISPFSQEELRLACSRVDKRVKSRGKSVSLAASKGAELPQKKWTAADAEKWIVYDAIFGAPRAKRPWGY